MFAGVDVTTRFFLRHDADYPPLLRETPAPPDSVYMRGVLPDLHANRKVVAIVGTRKAREASCSYTERWAGALVRSGCIVVSGMAMGIDAAAHRGALDATDSMGGGDGMPWCATIAVLATGTDRCYPERNRHLKERILANGCVLSEYPLGTNARPYFFLARNRIIAGLAHATIVIEAPLRSGSLATARAAVEANRDVLVVPGAIDDPQFEGSNELIRDGATLVRNIEDVFEGLGLTVAPLPTRTTAQNLFETAFQTTPDEAAIVMLLERHGTLSIDKIVELSKLSIHVVSRTLTMLALRHAIQENDNRYALARS